MDKRTKKALGANYGVVKRAIKCGHIPKLRKLEKIMEDPQTRGERIIAFAAHHLIVPEGKLTGQPLRLEPFQMLFILAIFDSPVHVRKAVMSVARRNGKSFLTAVIMLAFIVGSEAQTNSFVASAANSRDQAAIIFRLMANMLNMSPDLEGLYHIKESAKEIIGLSKNVNYKALSSDAKTGHGGSYRLILLDEAGQIIGPSNTFTEMLGSSQGSYDDPLFITISTQAPSDTDYLSVLIDSATINQPTDTVCHVYKAKDNCDVMKEEEWYYSNPGLDVFRDLEDVRSQARDADMMPSKEAGFRNLLLNQRISLENNWLSPKVWKQNNAPLNYTNQNLGVHIGLDLSRKNDLTAAVVSWLDDEGKINLLPHCFTPMDGIAERSKADKTPYDTWVKQGKMDATPGAVVDYDWICQFLKLEYQDKNIPILSIQFDRWSIEQFQSSAERQGLIVNEWEAVGQGYASMSPRIDAFDTLLLQNSINHGSHPLLNLGASNAIMIQDPAGNKKIDKSKSSKKIDPIIAALMSAYPLKVTGEIDIGSMIG